ncbi:PQQ-binding-like beta-propeller repeat protein [Actinomadura meridiana]|uniref:outer membrane protein assembly factor BamB family protein n=1 Tax=Actinomadura meridiana TaxID=559626 RepID=UPI0031ED2EBF
MPTPGAGSPKWDVPSHRWAGFNEDWRVPQEDEVPHIYGMTSDGQRAFTLRKNFNGPLGNAEKGPNGEMTAFDGATGKRLWRKMVPWLINSSPVGGNGIVVVAGGKTDDTALDVQPAVYTALDSATGAQRWQVKVKARKNYPQIHARVKEAPGVFYKGVFYYGDGAKIVGVDPATGRVRYQTVGKKKVIVAGPIVAGGRIVVVTKEPTNYREIGSQVQTAWAFTPELKAPVSWDFPRLEKVDTIMSSGDIVVSLGYEKMWATDVRTGRGLWVKGLPDTLVEVSGVLGTVIVAQDMRVNDNKKFLGYDLLSGNQLWLTNSRGWNDEFKTDTYKVGIVDGTLIAQGHGINILDATNGKKIFTQETNRGGGLVAAAAGHIVIYNHDGISAYK